MNENTEYQVLARKYRPQNFDDLIGQEAMVQTLGNAFSTGRIAHAFVLTGVRGIGKTTTARIIAKGLNCIGTDGQNTQPTITPCGQCAPCLSITEGRNIDVLELDAASNTQVDKMREILAGVPYRPSETRYKVYIFDEVHMLSNAAFNAILKTLEEPPEHVKFIFATTEIRKVPITVLSRCQRFDLKRIEPPQMINFLETIASKENAAISGEALRLLTRAAEGSVRDALSLLDQAIAMSQGEITAAALRDMMGLADQGRILDLFDEVMSGSVVEALENLRSLYHDGADPASVLKSLAEITHLCSLLSVANQLDDDVYSPEDLERARTLSERLSLPVLARTWQMLLKLNGELDLSPNRLMGAEMAIIRLCHVANEPPPGELLARLQNQASLTAKGSQQSNGNASGTQAQLARQVGGSDQDENPLRRFVRFEDVIKLVDHHRDVPLKIAIENGIRLANYSPGRIEFSLTPDAPADLPQQFSRKLQEWTGARWAVALVNDCSTPTLAETRQSIADTNRDAVENDPRVQYVMSKFPEAEILDVIEHRQEIPEDEGLAPIDDDWEAIDFDDIG